MKIKTLSLVPALVLAAGMSHSAFAAQGVAFVHGTGQQTDAYNDYWTGSFVNTVRQGLPNTSNYTVINCDFEQYMWADGARAV